MINLHERAFDELWHTLRTCGSSRGKSIINSLKVVVLSGSMEPSIRRGDLLVLTNYVKSQPLSTGDIVVYKLPGRGVPIVHRIIKLHEDRHGEVAVLSKGDNNIPDDRELYGKDREWLDRDMIIGRSCAFLPYAGILTILVRSNRFI